ncbi:MAG: glycosyltransferase, partial [Ignavibacteriae bacterium]|nr:glycosyltransferase [Ignavibacteriota bacterium]
MTRSSYNDVRVCMVAYANYFTDARIKNYVDALLDAGACVDVFALGRRKGTRNDGTLFIRALASKHWGSHPAGYVIAQAIFMLKVVLFLCARSFRRRYDIIHVHNMPNILTLTGLPFKLFGTKVILDIHDTMPEAYATKFDYSLDSLPVKLLRLEENIAARCSDRIIATNVLHKDVLISHGLPGETIDIILNVGNGKIFKPKPTVTNGAELWLGYHGTIARRLGVLLIVDAMHLLKDVCPCLRLLCIGEGDDL